MKDSKEKAQMEEADNKEHFMFPSGFQWQQPFSLPQGVPESKRDFTTDGALFM